MVLIKKFSSALFLLLMTAAFINPIDGWAQQERPDIKQLLGDRDQQIKELVGPKGTEYTAEQRNKLKDIINAIIDYRAMAQYALQETYDTLSTEQRDEFIDLFSTIVRDHSLNNLDIYRADVRYQEINQSKDSAVVQTLAQLEKVRTPVTYKMMYEQENQQWVVTDMVIDDVSTAESYRRQFQSIISKKGYDALLKTLRKKVQ